MLVVRIFHRLVSQNLFCLALRCGCAKNCAKSRKLKACNNLDIEYILYFNHDDPVTPGAADLGLDDHKHMDFKNGGLGGYARGGESNSLSMLVCAREEAP